MKKGCILILFFIICALTTSCGSDKIGSTDKQIAKYLSKIDGLTEIGSEDHDIPFKTQKEDWVLYIAPDAVHMIGSKLNDSNMMYYGLSLEELIRIRVPSGDQFTYYRYLDFVKNNYKKRVYLTNSIELPYLFAEIGLINCSPEWYEWLGYNIPQFVWSYEPHGLFNAYWFDPIDQKYEKVIYIREADNKTELYVVYHEMSLFYGTEHIAPYLLSEEMFEKMKTEFGDSFNADGYAKGSISEFSCWFMGEYLKEVPSVFENIEEEVYYPRYGGSLNYNVDNADEIVPEMIADLEKLGVDFDEITSCIIKITIPYNSKLKDISWELIA